MQLTKSHIALSVACTIVGIIIGASFRSCSRKEQPEGKTLLVDTVLIHDTVRIHTHTESKILRRDTCYLPAVVVDSATTDSVAVEVPITSYVYRDTFQTDTSRIELGICYEGYKAKIDGIDLQYRFECQPRIIEKKKGWGQFLGIGIGAGYGVSVVGNTVYAAPEVGVHVVYGFGYTWKK